MQRNIKQLLYISLGTFFLGIGVIGIIIPILPTTPFLLLAAFFYVRSSKRFYDWLLNNRIFGNYIKCYIEGKGMTLKVKLFTLAFLWITISLTTIFVVDVLPVKLILLLVATAVSIHIIFIKNNKK